MNKKCKECNNEFESINTKGSEQLYCSKSCRNKSANKRFQNNLINKHNEKIHKEGNNRDGRIVENNREGHKPTYTNLTSVQDSTRKNSSEYNSDIISCIKETFEERSKSIFYQLKCEQLEKQVQELKQDIINLEMELEEYNPGEEDSNGIISGLITSFKNDPQSTVTFATELITNFMKPKKAENV